MTELAAILTGIPYNNLAFNDSAYADAQNPFFVIFSTINSTLSLS